MKHKKPLTKHENILEWFILSFHSTRAYLKNSFRRFLGNFERKIVKKEEECRDISTNFE